MDQRNHRGTLIFVFGILGLILCVPLGLVAWIMGSSDLKQMNAGTMNPEGRGMTQAGKILGMIATLLWIIGIAIWIAIAFLAIGAATVAGTAQTLGFLHL